ncbi:RNaseH domain-containing protein [Trichocoleus sp. DQ-U1]|uniref:RNaseH domain-containing protein n=1 Tax=Trichocoleus sp. DQ-U1 TaxID=2933926 RepID=UPI003297962A
MMSNYFGDDMEFNEDLSELNEDEAIETESLYIPLGNPKSIKLVPLAFTAPDELPPVIVSGYALAWTNAAIESLSTIHKATSNNNKSAWKNLPYASLRGYLEVALKDVTRINSNLGLSNYILTAKNLQLEPFAYIADSSEEEIKKSLRPVLNDWLTNFLKPFAEKHQVSAKTIERLEDLREQGKLLTITAIESQVLPWKWSPQTGTTHQRKNHDYLMLADYVARRINGKEIFRGLGGMKRILSSGVNINSGIAELITDPISLDKTKGRFSLMVRLEVVTYPSLHQPLLKIDVSKRRWLSQLKSPKYYENNISGFIFSEDYPDRAFSYKVICKRDANNNYNWETDKDFEALRRQLRLPIKTPNGQDIDGQQIALEKASTERCQVLLTHRNGLQDNSDEDENNWETPGVETGVPEIDKLEAFEEIAKIIEPFGLKPFENYKQVKFKRNAGHKVDDTGSREINIFTLLGAILEMSKTDGSSDFTPQYLDKFQDNELESLLSQNFNIGLKDIHFGRKSIDTNKGKKLPDQTTELRALINANQAAMQRLYPNEKASLWIFHEDVLQREANFLKAIVRVFWGDAIKVEVNKLPKDTHGPRQLLPGKELNSAKERSRERLKAWEHSAKQLADRNEPTFCLIVARKFYSDSSGQKTVLPDDKVNKPSTRKALATKAHACVQFLEPIKRNPKTNRFRLDDFFHRMQSALKDLLSAHAGRIDDVQEKVNKYLADTLPEARPKEIIAITIVRKQKDRVRGRIENTFLPVAIRLKVETGKCELCCAYQDKNINRLEISHWRSFPDALAFIAELSPIKLADDSTQRGDRFMEFVKKIITTAVDEGSNPLIIIDSSNCVQLWSWLADSRLDVNKISFERPRSESSLCEPIDKEWNGARLIRIRQDLAPGIIDKTERYLFKTSLEDTRSKKELEKLTPTLKIPSASDAKALFRLTATNSTGCVAYLSVGHKAVHQNYRGQSCYYPIPASTPAKEKNEDGSQKTLFNKAGLGVHQLSTRPPFVKRWPTPNALEIVVTLKQEKDNPDQLAALVESLRYSFGHYSDWTSLPAPLFFERVVRDYISDFAIENEDTEAEQDLE